MAAIRPDSILISLLVFTFIIIVGTSIVTDVSLNYGKDYDSKFGEVYNITDELFDTSVDQKDDTVGGETDTTDALDSAISGATSALKLMTTPIQLIEQMVQDIMEQLKVPNPKLFATFVVTGLTIMIVFSLIYLWFRIRAW
jgi:hypothetical protein